MLFLTVGIEGVVNTKKSRIQLKIGAPSEVKEASQPLQGSSDPAPGKSAEEQVKRIVKAKRKVTLEDASMQEKRRKTTEDQPPRMQSSMDHGRQAKADIEVSEVDTRIISKAEWFEAIKPLRNLVRILRYSTIVYRTFEVRA